MPEKPTLALAWIICELYRDDDFKLVIMYGDQRIGKTAYGLKCMGQVYEYYKGIPLSPRLIDQYMGWDPNEVVDTLIDIDERIPCYKWDDAGYWLWALDWNDPVLKAFCKYLNVIGTDMNCLILSTPDPRFILSKIQNMPSTRTIRITKASRTSKWARIAKGYHPYYLPDLTKKRVKPWLEDSYSCKLPQDVYDYYQPIRRSYAVRAKRLLRKALAKTQEDKKEKKDLLDNLNYMVDNKEYEARK